MRFSTRDRALFAATRAVNRDALERRESAIRDIRGTLAAALIGTVLAIIVALAIGGA